MSGCVYIGSNTDYKRKNGYLKVGMTQDSKPTRRLNANKLTGNYYIYCPNASKAELLLLESYARVQAEKLGLTLIGNDHFHFNILDPKNKAKQADQYARMIADRLAQYAEFAGIEFEYRKCIDNFN